MLSREDNERLTARRAGHADGRPRCAGTGSPRCSPGSCRSRTVRPSASGCWARTSSRSATRAGRVGLLDEFCPHRRASLFFGRNEECGLRCVYHGWKFDVDGRCVDMMNEPEERQFKDKVFIASYPTVEVGGVVWAYMGPPERKPAPPAFAWTRMPATHMPGVEGDPGEQLAAGPGGRHRHLARADPAPAAHDQHHAARLQARQPLRARQGADARGRHHRLRLPLRGHPARSTRRASTCAPITSSCRSTRSVPRARRAACRWWPGTCGCRWTTRTPWSTTGSTARTGAPHRGGPARAAARQRAARRRPDDVPRRSATAGTTTCSTARSRRPRASPASTASTCRTAPSRRAWGAIVDRSREHLGPADRAIIQARRLLLEAVRRSQRGRHPARHRAHVRHARAPPRPYCRAAPTGARRTYRRALRSRRPCRLAGQSAA